MARGAEEAGVPGSLSKKLGQLPPGEAEASLGSLDLTASPNV